MSRFLLSVARNRAKEHMRNGRGAGPRGADRKGARGEDRFKRRRQGAADGQRRGRPQETRARTSSDMRQRFEARPSAEPRKGARELSRAAGPKDPGNYVIGRNAVRELLRHCPGRALKAQGARALTDSSDAMDQELHLLIKNSGIPFSVTPFDQLSKVCGSDSHQGWVVSVSPRPAPDLKELLAALSSAPRSLIILLDALEDPHNLGSILRAAECFGVDAVIFSKNRGARITPSVTKTSAGATELVTIVEVSNLHDAIEKCRGAGWWIIGAEARAGATDVNAFRFGERVALVLGAEGKGLHELTRKSLDASVFIPMQGRIDSLNVGQAAAVLMAACRRAQLVS